VTATDARMSIISTRVRWRCLLSEYQTDTGREPASIRCRRSAVRSTEAFLADLDGSVSYPEYLAMNSRRSRGRGRVVLATGGPRLAATEARPALRRDHAVDRTLLIRIIEGIERL
jgi:hypothetical protein